MTTHDPNLRLSDFQINYLVHHHHLLGCGWSYRFDRRHPRHALLRSDGVLTSLRYLSVNTIIGPQRKLAVKIHLLPEAVVSLNLPWSFIKRFAHRFGRTLDPTTTPREAARVLRDELLPVYEPLHRKILAGLQHHQIRQLRDGVTETR